MSGFGAYMINKPFSDNLYSYNIPKNDFDLNALEFIKIAGITDIIQQNAINSLVINLKINDLWDKMIVIYPMIGGTSTSHKFNLKNPVDSSGAFTLNFIGGWSHSSTGAKPNGINSYADTFFNIAELNNHHISYYSRTNSNNTEVEFGSIDASNNGSLIEIRTANISYFRINNGTGAISFADTDSRAFYVSNRTASNLINAWRNNVKGVQSTILLSSLVGVRSYFLGAFNNNASAAFYSIKECAFASIGTGLTDTEANNFYTIVQNYNTNLSRQV